MAGIPIRSVLISDAVDKACMDVLSSAGMRVLCKHGLNADQLVQELQGHDALIVRSETKVTASVLSGAPGLRVVGRAGTGVDNVDLDAATKRGVVVMNTPGGNSTSACELTCSLICCLARHVPQAVASLKGRQWQRKAFGGTELQGKTLAILGLGRIGREVAKRMQAFGMRTIGFDPMVSHEDANAFGVEKMELQEIWPLADYITVHTPLIPQTKNLLNSQTLSSCRRGVRVVNVARGGIVDEAALLEALESGQVGGAALDVFLKEPPDFKDELTVRLLEHPAVICTPHLGASTREAQQRVAVEIAENIVELSKGGTVSGVVNAPLLSASVSPENAPIVATAKALAQIALSLLKADAGSQIKLATLDIHVTATGTGLRTKENLLKGGVMVGALSECGHPDANLISVPTLAANEGLCVSADTEDGDSDTITLMAGKKGGKPCRIEGAVRGDGIPRLLSLNGCALGEEEGGFALKGRCLIFKCPSAAASASLGPLLGSLWGLGITVTAVAPAGTQPPSYIAVRTANGAPDGTRVAAPGLQLLMTANFS
ncbi:D-3-phosphoglycerate dehydrogenase [Ischnura elegans]|uniref:D-3-phosphoglycerate dehydrogenase n=1 Tax=Ischnura elegans TaxID=197161 RepID=UPI001ED87902|nr:D-3-phosphoglycerate dehydrogenase [Ischnura elegans]